MANTIRDCRHCGQLIDFRNGIWVRIEQKRPDWYPFSYPAKRCAAMAYADDEGHHPYTEA